MLGKAKVVIVEEAPFKATGHGQLRFADIINCHVT